MSSPDQLSLFGTIEVQPLFQDTPFSGILKSLLQDHGRVILMTGTRDLISLGHYLAARRLIEGDTVVFVDGANSIDLPFILRFARLLRADPRSFMKRIHLSRAFTAHQLESVIVRDLAGAMKRFKSRLCIVLGLLDTPTDDELPLWEGRRLLRNITVRLRSLADQGHLILLIAPDPAPDPISGPTAASEKTRALLPIVKETANRILHLSRDKNQLILE